MSSLDEVCYDMCFLYWASGFQPSAGTCRSTNRKAHLKPARRGLRPHESGSRQVPFNETFDEEGYENTFSIGIAGFGLLELLRSSKQPKPAIKPIEKALSSLLVAP